MGGWKSITKAVTKPFKEVGKAIGWTDIRYNVLGTELGAAIGAQHSASKALKEQREANALAVEQAEKIAAAQNLPVSPAAPAPQFEELAEESAASSMRRRYSLQRTVNTYSLRSTLGGGNRYSLG